MISTGRIVTAMKRLLMLIAILVPIVGYAGAQTVTTLWESSEPVGLNWSQVGYMAPEVCDEFKVGDVITVTVAGLATSESTYFDAWPQVVLKTASVGWPNVSGSEPVNGITQETDIKFYITEPTIEAAIESGLFVSGGGCYITKVTHTTSESSPFDYTGAIWVGSITNNNIELSPFLFSYARPGDIMVITGKGFVSSSKWQNLFFGGWNGEGVSSGSMRRTDTRITYRLSEAQLIAAANYGFVFQGGGEFEVNCIALQHPIKENKYMYAATGTPVKIDDIGNIDASEFEGYSDKAKVVFTYNVTGELTDKKGNSIIGWGMASIHDIGYNAIGLFLNPKSVGENSYTCTIEDLREYLDEVDPASRQRGLNFNVWEQGNANATRVSVEVFDVVGEAQ